LSDVVDDAAATLMVEWKITIPIAHKYNPQLDIQKYYLSGLM
jgi:hypothetical protein